MICPTCHGKGNKWAILTQQYITCSDCNGSGVGYCCDDAGTRSLNQGSVTPKGKGGDDGREPDENTVLGRQGDTG